jgi:hypothetical protein
LSKEEQYLQALLDGNAEDLPEATTIEEMYLRAMATPEVEEGLPTPYTKKVQLLKAILDKVNEGGFGGGSSNPPELLKSMSSLTINTTNAGNYSVGTKFLAKKDIKIHGVVIRTSNAGSVPISVHTTTGTIYHQQVFNTPTTGVNELIFNKPINIPNGETFIISYFAQIVGFTLLNLYTQYKIDIEITGYTEGNGNVLPTSSSPGKFYIDAIYSV